VPGRAAVASGQIWCGSDSKPDKKYLSAGNATLATSGRARMEVIALPSFVSEAVPGSGEARVVAWLV
jgi:hypothetical protein